MVEIEIPPRTPYVGIVRLTVASLARARGLDEERVDDIKIAVSEACANAVLTHEEQGSDEPVFIRWSEEGERILIEVADRGPRIDSGDVQNALDSQGFSTRAVMSIALLKSIVDGCDFEERDGGGTVTRLTVTV